MTDGQAGTRPAEGSGRLEHAPITFFATVMGLAGFALALHAAEVALGLMPLASAAARALTIAVFLAFIVLYAAKIRFHPKAVLAEWQHPVRLAFFPTVSISLIADRSTLVIWPSSARRS